MKKMKIQMNVVLKKIQKRQNSKKPDNEKKIE